MDTDTELTQRLQMIWPLLDERTRRLFAANEALAMGHGGITRVNRACGLSRKAISKGIEEIRSGSAPIPGRVRRSGAGRKPITETDPELIGALESLIDEQTLGDPESTLRWTCKSTRTLARELKRQGHSVSHATVAQLLHALRYSLQSNRKGEEGEEHPDRDAQFRHIGAAVSRQLDENQPVISVDTKKKELVGNYLNKGQQWRPAGSPASVQGHDFPGPEVPRAYPYGIYDLGRNTGFVNVGTDHDTSTFAVASIAGWWEHEGRQLYPTADRLQITADAGGSNGWRRRAWKHELQQFADRTGLEVSVCHFPPGTSKWNKIEHRLFSFISSNWRGEPLCDYETIVNLIANTSTAKGLSVTCRLDHGDYPTGMKISDRQMAQINLEKDTFHGEWNYVIAPREKQ